MRRATAVRVRMHPLDGQLVDTAIQVEPEPRGEGRLFSMETFAGYRGNCTSLPIEDDLGQLLPDATLPPHPYLTRL
jgi:hypothetical protein